MRRRHPRSTRPVTFFPYTTLFRSIFVAGLWFLFNRTRAGKIMRAAALDREMAQVLCINTKLVITAVFAFGAWLAAVGGVVAAPMRAIDPGMGDKIIIESFIEIGRASCRERVCQYV